MQTLGTPAFAALSPVLEVPIAFSSAQLVLHTDSRQELGSLGVDLKQLLGVQQQLYGLKSEGIGLLVHVCSHEQEVTKVYGRVMKKSEVESSLCFLD